MHGRWCKRLLGQQVCWCLQEVEESGAEMVALCLNCLYWGLQKIQSWANKASKKGGELRDEAEDKAHEARTKADKKAGEAKAKADRKVDEL